MAEKKLKTWYAKEEEIAPDEMAAARRPRVAAWWKSIQARPAFARAKIGPFVDSNSGV